MAVMAPTLRARPSRSAASSLTGEWVRPHWLERASALRDGGAAETNDRNRRWTVVGNLDAANRARVDPRGLVSVDGEPWSIDWWIGGEDRWHVPAREAGVRQSLLGGAPVVETRVRVPSGDAVQRVFAARDGAGGEAVVIEIENATKVPFAVAVALRPYDLDHVGGLAHVAAAGTELRAGDGLAALLPGAPRHAVASTAEAGDAAGIVFAGAAPAGMPVEARCPRGLATVAVLHPLAHTAMLRIVVPLTPQRPDPATLPDAATVVSGWRSHARAGTRIDVPDRRLQRALDTSLGHLLVQAGEVAAARALDRLGFHDLAAPSVVTLDRASTAAPGEALAVVTEHWTALRDPETARRLAPVVATLVASLAAPARRRLRWARPADSPDAATDRCWGIARLPVAAELLDAAGEARAARDVRATVAAEPDRRRGGTYPGADPSRPPRPDPGLAVAEAGWRGDDGDLDPAATLRRARLELAGGRWATAQARLSWALGAASSTWTWPATIPGDDPAGGLGDGHDLRANAELLLLARDVLVADLESGLAMSPFVPDAWLGQGWELHDAPTTHGRLSFAVRWHGARPALLWELDAPSGRPPVRLIAPGLDPTWSSSEPTGEALLAPVDLPERAPRRGLSIPVSIEPAPRGRP
jgi:hypothetical protein